MRLRKIFTTLILAIILFNAAAWAESIEARSAFKAGYELFGQEQYYPAIDSFKIAIIDTS